MSIILDTLDGLGAILVGAAMLAAMAVLMFSFLFFPFVIAELTCDFRYLWLYAIHVLMIAHAIGSGKL
jgi:hypothetical protein